MPSAAAVNCGFGRRKAVIFFGAHLVHAQGVRLECRVGSFELRFDLFPGQALLRRRRRGHHTKGRRCKPRRAGKDRLHIILHVVRARRPKKQ